ncbi:MAG: hypothetical protein PGN12_01745 [Sphingomonas phyllosphaerae]
MFVSRRMFAGLPMLAALHAFAPRAANASVQNQGDERTLTSLRLWLTLPQDQRGPDDSVLRTPLDRPTAEAAVRLLAADRMKQLIRAHASDVSAKRLSIGDRTMRWEERVYGSEPKTGRSLWISLHGGGNAPSEVNDQQWQNQIRLYTPEEGVYIAPRAPTDTWNLWHEAHMDGLLQTLIDVQVATKRVDPEKVYILGYSAGGDGVWQLAPRMADRFAAAATMAGHPGDAALPSLRNLPFAIFMGGRDTAYDRNVLAATKTRVLDELERADPSGYVHISRIYPGLPHWMDRRDAEAIPWMAHFTRHTWPKRVVWVQDDVPERRFYWLEIPSRANVKPGDRIDAVIRGQNVDLQGAIPDGTTLRLTDDLMNLDKSVTVTVNGKVRFRGRITRTAGSIYKSLQQRADVSSAATCNMTL